MRVLCPAQANSSETVSPSRIGGEGRHCPPMKTRASVAVLVMLGVSGCAAFSGKGHISAQGVTVQGVADAGKPATLATSQAGVGIALAAGSKVVVTKYAATPATETAPAIPEREETIITPSAPTEYRKTESTVKADTGTVDTSIKKHEIDAEERRPLLYAAIGAALAAGFFVYRAYPTPAICCGVASVVFFLAWRMADLPPWVAGVALAAAVGGVALWVGHNRGLYEPVPPPK